MTAAPITPTVSDHAVLRYMERVLGCDVEGVRRVIAEECALGAAMGAVSVVKGDVQYCLHNGCVTTVVLKRWSGTVSNTQRARNQRRIEAGV